MVQPTFNEVDTLEPAGNGARAHGYRFSSVPIVFRERRFGVSKLEVVLEAIWLVTIWGLARLIGRGPARRVGHQPSSRVRAWRDSSRS